MVSICAGCNVYPLWASFVIGVLSAPVYLGLSELLVKLKIDDPLDAVAGKTWLSLLNDVICYITPPTHSHQLPIIDPDLSPLPQVEFIMPFRMVSISLESTASMYFLAGLSFLFPLLPILNWHMDVSFVSVYVSEDITLVWYKRPDLALYPTECAWIFCTWSCFPLRVDVVVPLLLHQSVRFICRTQLL